MMLFLLLISHQGRARIGDGVHVLLRLLPDNTDHPASSANTSRRRARSSRKKSGKGKRGHPPTEATGDSKRQQVETLEEGQGSESQEEFADLVE